MMDKHLQSSTSVSVRTERDRQALVGLDARERCVKRQLSHRNAHAASAQVTQPEDAFPVRHHDSPNVVLWPEEK